MDIEFTCQCRRCKRYKFDPWVGKMPWSWKWQHTPVFLPGESHGQRSLVGYRPRGHKESDTTKQLHSLTHSEGFTRLWRKNQAKWDSQMALVIKDLPANAEDVRGAGSIPGMGRFPGGGHGNPVQYSCQKNPMYRGAWQATVHRVAKSWTLLKWLSMHAHAKYLAQSRSSINNRDHATEPSFMTLLYKLVS